MRRIWNKQTSTSTPPTATVMLAWRRCCSTPPSTPTLGIGITDHDTTEGALKARTLAEEYGIEVVVGEEVSTADGELLALSW